MFNALKCAMSHTTGIRLCDLSELVYIAQSVARC